MVSQGRKGCESRATPSLRGLEMVADGLRRGPGDFSDARALHQIALMMGSGEDTMDDLHP